MLRCGRVVETREKKGVVGGKRFFAERRSGC